MARMFEPEGKRRGGILAVRGEEAVALVSEQAQGEPGSAWCMDWLVKYYRQHGRHWEALAWQQKVFLLRPSAEEFQALRELSRELGTWEQVRAEALKALERSKRFGPLTEIALHKGDVPRALELLPRMQPWERGQYQWPVAQAAEKSHPQEALARHPRPGPAGLSAGGATSQTDEGGV